MGIDLEEGGRELQSSDVFGVKKGRLIFCCESGRLFGNPLREFAHEVEQSCSRDNLDLLRNYRLRRCFNGLPMMARSSPRTSPGHRRSSKSGSSRL